MKKLSLLIENTPSHHWTLVVKSFIAIIIVYNVGSGMLKNMWWHNNTAVAGATIENTIYMVTCAINTNIKIS